MVLPRIDAVEGARCGRERRQHGQARRDAPEAAAAVEPEPVGPSRATRGRRTVGPGHGRNRTPQGRAVDASFVQEHGDQDSSGGSRTPRCLRGSAVAPVGDPGAPTGHGGCRPGTVVRQRRPGFDQGSSPGRPLHSRTRVRGMNTHVMPEARFRTVDGTRIRYADSGGSQLPTILLTSPWPESLYAFAPIWTTLAERARLVAVDLPGFGRSERRDDLLSPRAMGGFLSRLITEAELGTPYVVAPDVGTPAALFTAAEHPEQVAGLGVGAGGTAVPLELGEPLASWVLDPDLDSFRQVDPHAVVNAALDTHAGPVPDDIRADYLASYEGDRFVESMRFVRRYPEELPQLAELLPGISTPVTVIGSTRDRVVPLANAEFLHRRLPHSRLVVLDSGHFAWEEDPAQYAAAVLDAIASDHG